jgi:hypothetical protein
MSAPSRAAGRSPATLAERHQVLSRRSLAVGLLAACLLAGSLAAASSAPRARFGRQAETSAGPEQTTPATTTTSAASAESETLTAAAATTTTTTTTTAAPTTTTAAGTTVAAKSKPKATPVNFTLVDELFEAVLDEPEVAKRWRKMDKTIQTGVGAALKVIFPHIVSMASDAKVSGNCSGAMLKWILSLKAMRTWAVRMLDAIGKPSAGLLEGSLTLFGNYKQCLAVRAPDEDEIEIADGEFREYFRGQYCVLQIKPPLASKPHFYSLNSTLVSLLRKSYKQYERTLYDELSELAMAFHFVNIRADLCVPSLCSRDDIQRVADFLTSKLDMRARVQRCEIQAYDDASQLTTTVELSHLLWSMTLVILMLLVLVSTLTNMVFRMRKRTSKSKRRSLFTSMSVYRSLSHIRDVQLDRINDSKPVVLYSLRIIILMWIFLVSLSSQLNYQYLRELLTLRDLIMQWPLQLLVNSSLQYDSLILLTAFTYAYQNVNSNFTDLIKYNVSKYTRLMPSIMLFVAITIITPLLWPQASPVWHDFVDEPARVCKSSGFINLFFLQNLIGSERVCLPQTWLFCVELQLCILAIPIVYLMNRHFDANQGAFKLTSEPILMCILLALAGCLVNFVNVYANQLPAAWFQTYPDKDDKHLYNTLHLYKTWTHLSAFAVGLFAGHLCRCQSIETFSGRPYGRSCCNSLMWLTSLALMGALVFMTHSWSLSGMSHLEAPLASATYAALAPLVWSISLSMILFQLTVPSDKNQHSCLARMLTSDANLVRIGRLSFLAYLINPYVNTLVYGLQEQPIFSSLLMLGHFFIGNLVITFALSFIVSALVELPCRRLFKKLLIGSRRQCTNLDIIQRQMDIRQRNQGPAHDSFLGSQAPAGAAELTETPAATNHHQMGPQKRAQAANSQQLFKQQSQMTPLR